MNSIFPHLDTLSSLCNMALYNVVLCLHVFNQLNSKYSTLNSPEIFKLMGLFSFIQQKLCFVFTAYIFCALFCLLSPRILYYPHNKLVLFFNNLFIYFLFWSLFFSTVLNVTFSKILMGHRISWYYNFWICINFLIRKEVKSRRVCDMSMLFVCVLFTHPNQIRVWCLEHVENMIILSSITIYKCMYVMIWPHNLQHMNDIHWRIKVLVCASPP